MATNQHIAKRQHRWLSSVEITGVVLTEPVLADAGNFRSLDKKEIADFRKAREIWNLPKGMVEGNGQPAWLNFIFHHFLGSFLRRIPTRRLIRHSSLHGVIHRCGH